MPVSSNKQPGTTAVLAHTCSVNRVRRPAESFQSCHSAAQRNRGWKSPKSDAQSLKEISGKRDSGCIDVAATLELAAVGFFTMRSNSIAAAIVICVAAPGCGAAKVDFKNVLVCLNGKEEVLEYKSFVEEYASSHGYIYNDQDPTRIALDARGDTEQSKALEERKSIYSTMESSSGLYVSISNWDHSESTVAHGFLDRSASDAADAEALASHFLNAVKTNWDVIELPLAENYWPTSCEDARKRIGALSDGQFR